ncbi:hypothetical protein A6R68_17216 [Neotoma lepida]|uniref:Uncharacterized protein n=1 Tax=Neotoma lepida TaxID=56216 RepID=A0A1A6HEI1_NEOLE|nr:hypothetical protein A6R68_17216 [Neotoma lepida]
MLVFPPKLFQINESDPQVLISNKFGMPRKDGEKPQCLASEIELMRKDEKIFENSTNPLFLPVSLELPPVAEQQNEHRDLQELSAGCRDHMQWSKEEAAAARKKVEENSATRVAPEEQVKFESDANKYWDTFYQTHKNKFFKNLQMKELLLYLKLQPSVEARVDSVKYICLEEESQLMDTKELEKMAQNGDDATMAEAQGHHHTTAGQEATLNFSVPF